uniref:Mitochondrial glycoprotein n=1 Tax=Leersia perrieri TaxID=77586 RepID=A0A0D9V692_9ORYZ
MLRRAAPSAAAAASTFLRHALPTSRSSSSSAAATAVASSTAVNSILLRSLKEHYLEVSKMTPPPKISPPKPYTIVKGALDQASGPVLRRGYGEAGEEISISVARLANIMPAGADDYESDDDGASGVSESINQLFLHVDISRPGSSKSLQFLCGLYPDAVGIHSVCLRSKTAESGTAVMAGKSGDGYQGRIFQELDENVRDAFHHYIEARGINEKLFPFLQAWLYVKDHRNLIRWFKSVGTFISEPKS